MTDWCGARVTFAEQDIAVDGAELADFIVFQRTPRGTRPAAVDVTKHLAPDAGTLDCPDYRLRVFNCFCQRFIQVEVFSCLSAADGDPSAPFSFDAYADDVDIVARQRLV
jgi:hypothetical protein